MIYLSILLGLLALATLIVVPLTARPKTKRPVLIDELEALSVVLHTKDGKSFRGHLTAVRDDGFLLERADALMPEGPQSIGTIVVPRANVSFFQRLPAEVA